MTMQKNQQLRLQARLRTYRTGICAGVFANAWQILPTLNDALRDPLGGPVRESLD
jgi:hypothetical protein